jgi:hypothetical protein
VNKLQFCEMKEMKDEKDTPLKFVLRGGIGFENIEPNKELSETDDLALAWKALLMHLEPTFGRLPDLNAILFLIGVQELGQGLRAFSKEEKQDLMHWAICRVLSISEFYEAEGKDKDGWVHWKPTKKMPYLDLNTQEKVLQEHILLYFEQEVFGE